MSAPSLADDLLIRRIRSGDADAWNELIARYEGFSIAAHKLTDHLRREGRRPTLPLIPDGSNPSSWEPAGRSRPASAILRSSERPRFEEDALVVLEDMLQHLHDFKQYVQVKPVGGWVPRK